MYEIKGVAGMLYLGVLYMTVHISYSAYAILFYLFSEYWYDRPRLHRARIDPFSDRINVLQLLLNVSWPLRLASVVNEDVRWRVCEILR